MNSPLLRHLGLIVECLWRRLNGTTVIGYVETAGISRFDHSRPVILNGWALSRDNSALRLTLTVGWRSYPLAPVWHYRDDVAQQYGAGDALAGFCCVLPIELSKLVRAAHAQGCSFIVHANGLPLRMLCKPDETFLLWEALRHLNTNLNCSSGTVCEQVTATWHAFELSKSANAILGKNYLLATLPLLCRHDQLACIEQLTDVRTLDTVHPTTKLSGTLSTLALLAYRGEVDQAVSIMQRLPQQHQQGEWLETETLYYAIVRLCALHTEGRLDQTGISAVWKAFLSLLDSFQGLWFSRLHDQKLVETMVQIISTAHITASADLQTIVAAAVRHYGLCPAFWRNMEKQSVPQSTAVLEEAAGHWRVILQVFQSRTQPVDNQPVLHALAWFHAQGNPEAIIYLRELALHTASGSVGTGIADTLVRLAPTESHRLQAADTGALWPTCWNPDQVPYPNRLQLVSKLKQMAADEPVVISVVRNERLLLPHFLRHYRNLGVANFIFVDNGSDDGTLTYLLQQQDAVVYTSATDYKHSHYGVAWQQAILGAHCLGRWALLADADEFFIYPGWEQQPLSAFINQLQTEGADAVLTLMIDRYPRGRLSDADFSTTPPFEAAPCTEPEPLIRWHLGSGHFSNAETFLSALRHRLAPAAAPNAFTSQKIALVRYQPWMRFSQGLHYAANVQVSNRTTEFAHFKYHAGFAEKVKIEVARGQHYNNAEEYRQFVNTVW